MMIISKKLYDFVSDFSKKNLEYNEISSDTTLEELGIDDLDLDLLMSQFVEKFNVDDSKFNGRLYFGLGLPLVDNNIQLIRKIVGKRKWLPLAKDELKPFTLGNLDKAIETGFLE